MFLFFNLDPEDPMSCQIFHFEGRVLNLLNPDHKGSVDPEIGRKPDGLYPSRKLQKKN